MKLRFKTNVYILVFLFMSMTRTALFPGSFDPITLGHIDLIDRSCKLFDHVIIAIGQNSQKKYLFDLERRLDWLQELTKVYDNLEVDHYTGLTVKFAEQKNANYLIRGLRNSSDFDYEKQISQINQVVSNGLETIFFIAQPQFSHISSTLVREIINGGGDVSKFLPEFVQNAL